MCLSILYLRISILSKVESALEEYIVDENPDEELLLVYASCVEKLEKTARNSALGAGAFKHYPSWLKKCVRVGRLLVSDNPECERYLQALAHYAASLGDLKKGKAARECYEESLNQFLGLQELGINDTDLLHDMSVCYDRLGDADAKTAARRAREWYLKCLELRETLIDGDAGTYEEGMFATPIKKLVALKGNLKVELYEKLLSLADKAGDVAPYDSDILLLVPTLVNALLHITGFDTKDTAHCAWYEMEVKALERVVALDGDVARYFWWLSDSYRGLAENYAVSSPGRAIEYYGKCLDNREKVIEMDGENICYSCGLRPVLLKVDALMEHAMPEARMQWYGRWLSITKSSASRCSDVQIREHRSDIRNLKSRLGVMKK